MVELLDVDTGVAPFVAMGDLTAAKHSALLGHTDTVAEPLGFGCTTVSARTAAEVQPASVVAME